MLEQGLLTPGRYTLIVESSVSHYAGPNEVTASFDFSMVVPEPSTALLVGAGLAAMAGSRRRSGARRPS